MIYNSQRIQTNNHFNFPLFTFLSQVSLEHLTWWLGPNILLTGAPSVIMYKIIFFSWDTLGPKKKVRRNFYEASHWVNKKGLSYGLG